ncbi:hypothetical protein KAJ87_00235 [Candidatus Pacearchaeota archaeon]|nr:hypothetical protein [Candidatus Pacearchaeota archaeon]
MKIKVTFFRKAEEQVLEGEYSYVETGDEGEEAAVTVSVTNDKTEGDFDIKFNGSKKEMKDFIDEFSY